MERVGLFGGSFDPIHNGHLFVANAIAERFELEKIIFLPSAQPPHKETSQLTPSTHRARMVQLAVADTPLFDYSDFDMSRTGPTYTIDTVNHFRKELGESVRLFWIIGADWLAEIHTWKHIDQLADACQIVTAARSKSQELDWSQLRLVLTEEQLIQLESGIVETPLIDASSTNIRQRLRKGLSVQSDLPKPVCDYIEANEIYRPA